MLARDALRGLRKGQAFALYVAMYTFGRIFFEWMRVDRASKIFGIRFNLLLSVALCVVGIVVVRPARPPPGRSADPAHAHPEADQGSFRIASDQGVSVACDPRASRRTA